MQTDVIALLDKQDPPEHAFVSGLLATAFAECPDVRVRILVSRSALTKEQGKPRRFHKAVCIPRLFPRRGLGRLTNFFQAIRLIFPQIRKARRKQENVVIFVRNCPVLLLAAVFLKPLVDRVVFQSSFPHELTSANAVMRWIARSLFRLSAPGVDAILAVSPLGLERLRRLFGPNLPGDFIPLLADSPLRQDIQSNWPQETANGVRFIYVGSHSPKRHLDLVLGAIGDVLDEHPDAWFRFVGGLPEEISVLRESVDMETWENSGRVEFVSQIPRSEIWGELAGADVGLCMIPPLHEYVEASPTKLAEYMSTGLAIIASKGIPLQEDLIRKSEAGLLVDWSREAMSEAIKEFIFEPGSLARCKQAGREYFQSHFNPLAYVNHLREALGLPADLDLLALFPGPGLDEAESPGIEP